MFRGWKGAKLRQVFILLAVVTGIIFSSCAPSQQAVKQQNKVRMTVDFQQGQALKYNFHSYRDITVDWGKMPDDPAGKTKIDKSSESLDLVVSYMPQEVNPFGFTKIKAVCESANVTRTGPPSRHMSQSDAAQNFAGKSWIFTVGPTGKMDDRSNLYDVIKQVGQTAFRSDKSQGVIKEPDMIYDFIASQWFLWDPISSISRPASGVKIGEKWQSKLFVPAPMILYAARDVNYTLAEVRPDPNNQIAVIDSNYYLLYPCPSDWPVPYTEAFSMSGMFGFLRGYKVLDLQGQGQEIFNVTTGRIVKDTQKYTMNVLSSLPLLAGITPKITIEQTMTMDLISPKER
jgi:hypothetical protein